MSLTIAEIKERPIISAEDALQACQALVEAYRKGAGSESMEWNDVDDAYKSALTALGMSEEDNEPTAEELDDEEYGQAP